MLVSLSGKEHTPNRGYVLKTGCVIKPHPTGSATCGMRKCVCLTATAGV